MVRGINAAGEESLYIYNGLGALVENTWIIAENAYGYHGVNAGTSDNESVNGQGNGNSSDNTAGNNGNGNVKKTSNVIKQFVVDFTSETFDPLMEHEVNGLDYRYVYSDKARLSVVVQGIENGSASLLDEAGELHAYYHTDYLGTTDYLTSAVNSKVISWTYYNEWGEITHNAVLNYGARELDLVKLYATHDFDAVLTQYYAKARFYDMDNRRFTAVDPILDASEYDLSQYAADPMQLVQYLYVKDNAINWIDPLGLTPVSTLNYYKNAYLLGYYSDETLADALFLTRFLENLLLHATVNGLQTNFHELAQIHVAKAIQTKGLATALTIQLEKPLYDYFEKDYRVFPYRRVPGEIDIAYGISFENIIEVKPHGTSATTALDKYYNKIMCSGTGQMQEHVVSPVYKAPTTGWNTITNISLGSLMKDYKMGIYFSATNPGEAYYFFYPSGKESIALESAVSLVAVASLLASRISNKQTEEIFAVVQTAIEEFGDQLTRALEEQIDRSPSLFPFIPTPYFLFPILMP